MATGSFDITLRPDTPNEVRNFFADGDGLDTVIVTPGQISGADSGVPQLSLSSMLSASIFTGQITGLTLAGPGQRSRISGSSIVGFLGDSSGKGSWQAGSPSGAAALGTRLIAQFNAAENSGGITLGTTTGISSNTITDSGDGYESPRSYLDRMCQMTTTRTEWRVRHSGVMDFTPAGTYAIFPGDPTSSDPNVIIGRGLTDEISLAVVWGYEDLTIDIDYSEYASEVYVSDGTNTASASNFIGSAFDATTALYRNVKTSVPFTTSALTIGHVADQLLAYSYVPRYRYSLSLGPERILARHLAPGARFYLWDPYLQQYDVTNSLIANGEQIHPKLVRCTGITYPITRRMGVYGIKTLDASGDLMDFTRWVDYSAEPARTTIDVGTQPANLTRSIRQGIL